MYKNAKPLFLICETPLHVGSGSDLGIVDLPIQRERHTNFPKIEASSLKGALREAFENPDKKSTIFQNGKQGFDNNKYQDYQTKIHRTFGFDEASADTHAKTFFGNDTQFSGALALTDARLLLFPVKSLYGVFAWITCPRVIKKFISDLGLTDISFDFTEASVNKTTSKSDVINKEGKVYLEEFVFTDISKDAENGNIDKLASWLKKALFGKDDTSYWAEKIEKDIIVLDDKDFRDFVTLATEVITRTKINNATGTVQDGALFSEEYLPAESILYSLAMFSDEFRNDTNKLKSKNKIQVIQMKKMVS